METTVTGCVALPTLEDWFWGQVVRVDNPADRFTLEAVLASGVAREDVDALVAVLGLPSVKDGARVMRSHLLLLQRRYPDLGLHAAIGWVLVASDAGMAVEDLVGVWFDAGLGETGWLFAAAGLSLVEGAAVQAADDPDRWDAVRVLAALGGASLPHG